jgi:hypothetical protein
MPLKGYKMLFKSPYGLPPHNRSRFNVRFVPHPRSKIPDGFGHQTLTILLIISNCIFAPGIAPRTPATKVSAASSASHLL